MKLEAWYAVNSARVRLVKNVHRVSSLLSLNPTRIGGLPGVTISIFVNN